MLKCIVWWGRVCANAIWETGQIQVSSGKLWHVIPFCFTPVYKLVHGSIHIEYCKSVWVYIYEITTVLTEQSLLLKTNFIDIGVLLQCMGPSSAVRNTQTKSVIACSVCESFLRYLQSSSACCFWPGGSQLFQTFTFIAEPVSLSRSPLYSLMYFPAIHSLGVVRGGGGPLPVGDQWA